MPTPTLWRLSRLVLLSLSLGLTACDSGGDTPTPTPTPTPLPTPVAAPTFSIASQVVPFDDGSQGLQFYTTPSEDVTLVRVDIKNPVGQSVTFNANNNVALANGTFALQDPSFAYFRISGTWTFTFIGSRAAGDRASFNVVVPLSVGALTAPSVPAAH